MHQVNKYIISLSILILCFYTVTLHAEETKYNKNVSVVFDDSGSMAFDVRWAHANYALQTLVSVLDEGDILQIHYMNASEKDLNIIIEDNKSMSNILSSIRSNSVPDLLGDGETPIGSIEVGLNKLKKDNQLLKSNTIYDNWLVLITDGNEMTDGDGKGYVNYVVDPSFSSGYKWTGILDRKIASLLSESSIDYSTVILKIGDSSQDMLLSSSMIGSPLIYKSASVSEEDIKEKQIIGNMNDIASLISGRLPIEILSVKGNAITIKSQVPFNNFDVLVQNSGSKVNKVSDDEGNELDVNISYTELLSPETSTLGTRVLESDTTLYGSAIRIVSNLEEALPEGEYSLTFDENVEAAKVASYCYPDIQFIFKYYVNDIEVERIYQDDMISLEFIPVRGGTTEVLTDLPSSIRYKLELKSGEQFLTFVEGTLKTNEFLIKDDMIEGSLTAEIPDVWLWSLNVSESVPVARKEEKPIDRVFTLEVSNQNTSIRFGDFDEAPYVYLTPYLNGERIEEEDMSNAELNIVRIYSDDGSLTTIDYELTREGNSFKFKPVYEGFMPNMPSDSYSIEMRFASNEIQEANEYAFGEFIYTIEDANFFIRYLSYILSVSIVSILGIYLIGLVIKPRIRNDKYHIKVSYYESVLDLDDPIHTETFNFKVKQLARIFVPFKREEAKAADFVFKAGRKADYIYITKETQFEGLTLGDFSLKKEFIGQRDLRLNLDQKMEFISNEKLIVYQYTKS